MKKILGPLLLVILLLGVGGGIYYEYTRGVEQHEKQVRLEQITEVKGLVGSEKIPLLRDPKLLKILREKYQLDLVVEKAGSRQIATSFDVKKYDFVFPAGQPAAEKIKRELGVKKSYDPFFTPMAIASWKPIAKTLEAEGIISPKDGHYYIVDMKRLLSYIDQGIRWKDLKDNTSFAISRAVLINSTDVRKSNSAAMYLSLASYVANDDTVVSSDEEAAKIMPLMKTIFLKQGFQESSSSLPFQNYLTMGMGKSPMLMVYESQFIEYFAESSGAINPNMVLMYPAPTVFSKHILLAASEAGERLGEALKNDPEVKKIVVQHGFRNDNVQYFKQFTKGLQIDVPMMLNDVIDPPSYEVLEKMIVEIEQQYR